MNSLVRKILKSGLRLMRWAVRKLKGSETRPYQLPLHILIKMTEIRYREATMRDLPLCPECGFQMMFRHSKIVTNMGPVRDDMGFKCTICFRTVHHGIPMTREDALAEIELRGSPTLMRPTERPDEDGLDVVKERLRRLGYIE